MHSKTPIALITGASRGLGKSTALKLGAQGTDVIVTYREQANEAKAVVQQLENLGRQSFALQLDVADIDSFAGFAATLQSTLTQHFQRPQLSYLINNAGAGIYASFADTTSAQFDALMQMHLKGPFFLTQALLPLMQDGGSIINISSGLARFSMPGYAAYAAMKGGLEVLTRYLAKELGARQITVNTIAPGAIATDFGGGAVRDNPAINTYIKELTALGRVGLPDDIGGAIASLLRPDNSWVNGQRIEISGGIYL
jgi:NAD(P)-dependent dehydrogenase (short-subunit alcohol dehydrogenase family)